MFLPESDWYSPMYRLVRYRTVSADLPTCFPPMTTSLTDKSTGSRLARSKSGESQWC